MTELVIALGVWLVLIGFALMFNHAASKDRDRPDLDEQLAYQRLYGHPRIGIDPPENFDHERAPTPRERLGA